MAKSKAKNSEQKNIKSILKKNKTAADSKRELRVLIKDIKPEKIKKEESPATSSPKACQEEFKKTLEKATITTDKVSEPNKTPEQEEAQRTKAKLRPELKVSLPLETYLSAMKKREKSKVMSEKLIHKKIDKETTTDKNEVLMITSHQMDYMAETIVERLKKENNYISKEVVVKVDRVIVIMAKLNEKLDLLCDLMGNNNTKVQTFNGNSEPNNNNRITHEEPMRVAEAENENVTNNEIGNNTEVVNQDNISKTKNKPIEDNYNNVVITVMAQSAKSKNDGDDSNNVDIPVMAQSTESKNDKDDSNNVEIPVTPQITENKKDENDSNNAEISVMAQSAESRNDKVNDEEKIEENATNSNDKTNQSKNTQNPGEGGENLMDAVKEISDMNKTILKSISEYVPMLDDSNIKVNSILPETPMKLQRIRQRRQTFTPGMAINLSAPTRRPSIESLEQRQQTTQKESSLSAKSLSKDAGTRREDTTQSRVAEDVPPLPVETPRRAKKIMPRRMTVSTSHPLNLSTMPESPPMDPVYEGLLALHTEHSLTQYPVPQDGERQANAKQVQSLQHLPKQVPAPVPPPETPTTAKRIFPRRKSIATTHPLLPSKHYEEPRLESQSTVVDSIDQRTNSSQERNIARKLINPNSRRLSMFSTEAVDVDDQDEIRNTLLKYKRPSFVKEEDNPLFALSVLAGDGNIPTVANSGTRLPTSTQSGSTSLPQTLGCLQTGTSQDYSQEPVPMNAVQQNAMENANNLAMDATRAANELLGLCNPNNPVNLNPSLTIQRVARKINAADPRTRSAQKRDLRSNANPENQMLYAKKPMYPSDYSAMVAASQPNPVVSQMYSNTSQVGSQPNPVASQMYSSINTSPMNIQTSSTDTAAQNTRFSMAHMQRFPPPPLPPKFDSLANVGAVAYAQHAHNAQQYAVAGMPYAHNMGGIYNPQPVNAPYSSGYGHSMDMPAESSRTRNNNNAGMMEKSAPVVYPHNMQYTSALYDPEMPRVNQSPTNNPMGYYPNMQMLYQSNASPNRNTQPPGRPPNAQGSQPVAMRNLRSSRTRSKR